MSTLRVIHILEKNRFDTGSVHQMFQAAAGFAERGHEVAVITRPSDEMARRCAAAGVRFVPLPLRNELDLASIRGIRRLVDEQGTDVIHVHKGRPHTLALAATWRRPVGAFVVNRGVSFDLTVWNRPKYTTSRVQRIVTVCEDIRQVIIRSGKVPPSKVEVVYAGTDITQFDPAKTDRGDFRAERSIPDDLFVFATVGIRDWKGWREVIDGVSLLEGRGLRAGAMLIGCKNDEDKQMVAAYAAQKGIGDRAWPIESRDDMPRVLAAADCVVDASWAGTGITGTIREGMALERPVIATDCGGNRELVDASVGWLIPAKSDEALTGAMIQVMDGSGDVAARARAARDRVVRGFSRDARLDHLERIYREILGQRLKG